MEPSSSLTPSQTSSQTTQSTSQGQTIPINAENQVIVDKNTLIYAGFKPDSQARIIGYDSLGNAVIEAERFSGQKDTLSIKSDAYTIVQATPQFQQQYTEAAAKQEATAIGSIVLPIEQQAKAQEQAYYDQVKQNYEAAVAVQPSPSQSMIIGYEDPNKQQSVLFKTPLTPEEFNQQYNNPYQYPATEQLIGNVQVSTVPMSSLQMTNNTLIQPSSQPYLTSVMPTSELKIDQSTIVDETKLPRNLYATDTLTGMSIATGPAAIAAVELPGNIIGLGTTLLVTSPILEFDKLVSRPLADIGYGLRENPSYTIGYLGGQILAGEAIGIGISSAASRLSGPARITETGELGNIRVVTDETLGITRSSGDFMQSVKVEQPRLFRSPSTNTYNVQIDARGYDTPLMTEGESVTSAAAARATVDIKNIKGDSLSKLEVNSIGTGKSGLPDSNMQTTYYLAETSKLGKKVPSYETGGQTVSIDRVLVTEEGMPKVRLQGNLETSITKKYGTDEVISQGGKAGMYDVDITSIKRTPEIGDVYIPKKIMKTEIPVSEMFIDRPIATIETPEIARMTASTMEAGRSAARAEIAESIPKPFAVPSSATSAMSASSISGASEYDKVYAASESVSGQSPLMQTTPMFNSLLPISNEQNMLLPQQTISYAATDNSIVDSFSNQNLNVIGNTLTSGMQAQIQVPTVSQAQDIIPSQDMLQDIMPKQDLIQAQRQDIIPTQTITPKIGIPPSIVSMSGIPTIPIPPIPKAGGGTFDAMPRMSHSLPRPSFKLPRLKKFRKQTIADPLARGITRFQGKKIQEPKMTRELQEKAFVGVPTRALQKKPTLAYGKDFLKR